MPYDFPTALAFALRWEGGFVNDPADPGGATNKGVTQKTYDAWRKQKGQAPADVRQITDAEVRAIYEGGYWRAAHCDEVPGAAAVAVFDMAVNMGVSRAIKLLQRASGAGADGAWGPNTRKAAQAMDGTALAGALCTERETYYRTLAAQRPTLGKFLKGWLNRVRSLRELLGLGDPVSFGPESFGPESFGPEAVYEDVVTFRIPEGPEWDLAPVALSPPPAGWPRCSAAVYYDDAAAAIAFLERAFAFSTRIRIDRPDGGVEHSELTFGEAVVMVAGVASVPGGEVRGASPRAVGGRNTQSLFLYVDAIDAHCERARAAGAVITREPTDTDYGENYWADRGYEAVDPEGHRWWFAERLRTAAKA